MRLAADRAAPLQSPDCLPQRGLRVGFRRVVAVSFGAGRQLSLG